MQKSCLNGHLKAPLVLYNREEQRSFRPQSSPLTPHDAGPNIQYMAVYGTLSRPTAAQGWPVPPAVVTL
jgi:hypothetical protein